MVVVIDRLVVHDRAENAIVWRQIKRERGIDVITLGTARAFPFVGLRMRIANEGLNHVVGKTTAVETHERARQAQLAESLRYAQTTLFFRVATGHSHAAAGCANVRRFDVRIALRDRLGAGVFLIGVFLREDRIAAGVVNRHAVNGEANLIRAEAANRQAAAEQARRVMVKRVDAGQDRQRLIGVAGGAIFLCGVFGDRAAAFGGVFIQDLTRAKLVALADHRDGAEADGVVFGARRGVLGSGRGLGKRAGYCGAGEREGNGAGQQIQGMTMTR